jgi:hypothetical protein
VVAAWARPIIAGDKASQTAVAFDDFRNARRLTDTVFISFPPRAFLSRRYWFAAVRLSLTANV